MRGETIKAERRRRNGASLQGNRQRLGLNEAQLDRANYVYRWVNDVGTRLYDLTVNDDWEIVTDRDGTMRVDSAGAGAEVATVVDADKTGKAIRGVLCRKLKSYHDDDRREKSRAIDEQEALIGQRPTAGGDAHVYVKDETRLSRDKNP